MNGPRPEKMRILSPVNHPEKTPGDLELIEDDILAVQTDPKVADRAGGTAKF